MSRPLRAGRCTRRSPRSGRARSQLPTAAPRLEPIADRGPFLVARHVLHQDLLAARLVERAQVRIQIVRIGVGTSAGIDPGDRWIGLERQPHREHRHAAPAFGHRLGTFVDFVDRHDAHRRHRRVVRRLGARNARRGRARADDHVAYHFLDLRVGDETGAQQSHLFAIEAHDGGFEADLAFATIQHHAHGVAEFLAHVLGAGRTHAAKSIGRRRGDAATESRQQLLRHGMRGHADGDGILAAGNHVVHVFRAQQHHGQRPRPESRREFAGIFGHVACPAMQVLGVVEVDDDRVVRRAFLELENAAHRRRVLRVGAKSVDRFGRKRHELAIAQRGDGIFQLYRGSSNDSDHATDCTGKAWSGLPRTSAFHTRKTPPKRRRIRNVARP